MSPRIQTSPENDDFKPSKWFRKLSQTEINRLELWRVFALDQGEIFPPALAADFLRMTPEGVRSAANRGWIRYIKLGKDRFYGKKSLENYKYSKSRKLP